MSHLPARITPAVVRRWVDQQDQGLLDQWWRTGEASASLNHAVWERALLADWMPGVHGAWACGWTPAKRLLTTGWALATSLPFGAITALLDRTWSRTATPAIARAQRETQALALDWAYRTGQPAWWDDLWSRGAMVNTLSGGALLCSLLQERFSLFDPAPSPLGPERAAFLDRAIEQMVAAEAPLNAHHLVALLGACVRPPDPAQHALLDRLLTRAKPGIDERDLGLMLGEMGLVARVIPLDPALLQRVQVRVLAWGAPEEVRFDAAALSAGGVRTNDWLRFSVTRGRSQVVVQGRTVQAPNVPALRLDPPEGTVQRLRWREHWPALQNS